MKIKRSLVCAIVVGIMLPLAAPASAIGARASAGTRGGYAAVAAASSWSLASWLGALLTAMWGQERGYIDPAANATSGLATSSPADSVPTY